MNKGNRLSKLVDVKVHGLALECKPMDVTAVTETETDLEDMNLDDFYKRGQMERIQWVLNRQKPSDSVAYNATPSYILNCLAFGCHSSLYGDGTTCHYEELSTGQYLKILQLVWLHFRNDKRQMWEWNRHVKTAYWFNNLSFLKALLFMAQQDKSILTIHQPAHLAWTLNFSLVRKAHHPSLPSVTQQLLALVNPPTHHLYSSL